MGDIKCPECGGKCNFNVYSSWGNHVTFETCPKCEVLWKCYPWGQRVRETFEEHWGKEEVERMKKEAGVL